MSELPEDMRIAVGFSVTLSGQLVQAAVTLLTVQGAYVAYALASRETKPGFELMAGLAVLVFILSIYFSGKGVTAARNAGAIGAWKLDAGQSYFNKQALFLIIGVVLLTVMIFFSGNSKETDVTRKLTELSKSNALLDSKITALSLRVEAEEAFNSKSLLTLKSEVDVLRNSLAAASAATSAKGHAKQPRMR
jgi:hypothetical protein